MQILTSDLTAPAAALLAWLRCRWRIENMFKYLTAHHGIDALCDYRADTTPDTTPITNPARVAARKTLTAADTELADAERALAQLLQSTAHHTTNERHLESDPYRGLVDFESGEGCLCLLPCHQ